MLVFTSITCQWNRLDGKAESGRWNPLSTTSCDSPKCGDVRPFEHATNSFISGPEGCTLPPKTPAHWRSVCFVGGGQVRTVVIPPNSFFLTGSFFGTVNLLIWASVYISVPAAAHVYSELSTRGRLRFKVNATTVQNTTIILIFFLLLRKQQVLTFILSHVPFKSPPRSSSTLQGLVLPDEL